MPDLIYYGVRRASRALIALLIFALAYLRSVYNCIPDFNFGRHIMPDSRSIPLSSSVSNRSVGNNEPQDINTTILIIEDVQAHEVPNENVMVRNEEQEDTDNESFYLASNELESMSSIIDVNTNDGNVQDGNAQEENVQDGNAQEGNVQDGNVQERNQNNVDEMIVATLAFCLECCDKCVIL